MDMICRLLSFCLLYLFVWPVSLWVFAVLGFNIYIYIYAFSRRFIQSDLQCILAIHFLSVCKGFKDLWNNSNHLAKWYRHVMRSRAAWNYVRRAFPWK